MNLTALRHALARHKGAVRDASLLLATVLLATYGCYAVDLFEAQDALTLQEATIELDEALLLGRLISLALLIFGVRQYRAQKAEMAGRIAAEPHARSWPNGVA